MHRVTRRKDWNKKLSFVKGVGGYNIYRIPSLLVTPQGTILAFCEAREAGDSSDIDLILRRSEDGGKTWSRKQVVWDEGKNVCGNPCPVVDQETGIIWLLMTWNDSEDSDRDLHRGTGRNTRRVYVCRSKDDGHSWSQPVEITQSVKRKDWYWYATGPGVGIQLRQKPYQGRLVIPCDHSSEAEGYASQVIYSDDHGASWQLGASVPGGCNECQVVELIDDSLMLNMRLQKNGPGKRGIAISKDGGVTWSKMKPDSTLDRSRLSGEFDPVFACFRTRQKSLVILQSGPDRTSRKAEGGPDSYDGSPQLR